MKHPQNHRHLFSNPRNYYYRLSARPKSQFESMFDVDVLDEEPKALPKLIKAIDQKFDDRRFAIELQFNDDLTIAEERPLCMFYQKLSYEARWKRHPPAAQAA